MMRLKKDMKCFGNTLMKSFAETVSLTVFNRWIADAEKRFHFFDGTVAPDKRGNKYLVFFSQPQQRRRLEFSLDRHFGVLYSDAFDQDFFIVYDPG